MPAMARFDLLSTHPTLVVGLNPEIVVAGAPAWRWLEARPLVYCGRISYGLYLWSVLLLALSLPGWATVALSFAAADLSWRLVERRVQTHVTAASSER